MAFLDTLLGRILDLGTTQPRALVAIDGPDAAGKTTLADTLAARIGPTAVRASIDHFEHPTEHRIRHGHGGDSYYRDGFDHETFRTVLLTPFATGADRVVTEWRDPLTDDRREVVVVVPPRAILVADGVFLQRRELRDLWSLVIYVTVSPEVSLERARVRDLAWNDTVEDVERGYRDRYLPGQVLYRADVDPEATADILVDNTDPAAPIVLRD